jgi:hypothetical protein
MVFALFGFKKACFACVACVCLGVAYVVLFNYEFFAENRKGGFGFWLLDSRKLSGWQKICFRVSVEKKNGNRKWKQPQAIYTKRVGVVK